MDIHLHLQGSLKYLDDQVIRKHRRPMNTNYRSVEQQLCELCRKKLRVLPFVLELELVLVMVSKDIHPHLLASK